MGRLLIINGSPRAPRSNSRRYAALFRRYWKEPVDEYLVTDCQHTLICAQLSRYDHLLLVFPLYADALPAALLRFLQEMERALLPANLRVHTLGIHIHTKRYNIHITGTFSVTKQSSFDSVCTCK